MRFDYDITPTQECPTNSTVLLGIFIKQKISQFRYLLPLHTFNERSSESLREDLQTTAYRYSVIQDG